MYCCYPFQPIGINTLDLLGEHSVFKHTAVEQHDVFSYSEVKRMYIKHAVLQLRSCSLIHIYSVGKS